MEEQGDKRIIVENGDGGDGERKKAEPEVYRTKKQVVYGLEDVPPWYATALFGFQVRHATMI